MLEIALASLGDRGAGAREAGAWRALIEDGDVRHFLRVFGQAGERGLAEHLAGFELPVEALERELRSIDLMDMTLPDAAKWREVTVKAAYTVAEYRAGDKSEDARAQALGRLSPEELLRFARAAEAPRGFAGGDEATHRQVENARKRARGHVQRVRREARGQ